MTKIQDLLDQEAVISDKEERKKLHVLIKLMRAGPAPGCWGEDDCSTSILSRCPWRIDCNEPYSNNNKDD